MQRLRSRLLSAAVIAGAVAMIGLTWGFTAITMFLQRNEAGVNAESDASNLARTMAWDLTRQFHAIDQNLQSLAADYRRDPTHFDAEGWKRRLSLLDDAAPAISIMDARGIVVCSTSPGAVGADWSGRDIFREAESAAGLSLGRPLQAGSWEAGPTKAGTTEAGLLGAGTADSERGGADRWEIDFARRIDSGNGGFGGAVAVGFDTRAITSLFSAIDLGPRGLVELLGADGSVRALAGPGHASPGADIADTDMYRHAIQIGNTVWVGASAPDGVQRIHAFRRIADQNLTVVVGLDRAEALRNSEIWGGNAHIFALGVTGMILVIALLLIREINASSRREERLAHDRLVVEEAYAALELAKSSADEKRGQLEATLSGMSDGVMMLDDRLRLIEWNEKFAVFCGLPPAALRRGMGFDDILRAQAMAGEFGDVAIDTEVERRMLALRSGRSVGVFERLRPNGRTIELRRTSLPGGGYVTMYSDITARKQVEEAHSSARRLAEEAAEQKSRFVATVSHEIRTPLNAVVNSLGLLDRSALSQAQHKLADTAREAGDALLDLFNDILELSKTEAGVLALRPSVFDPRPMLEGVRDMFVDEAMRRDISLVLDIDPGVPALVEADCGRLRQVAMNFVSNATKFSLPGTVTIRVDTCAAEAGARLRLAVSDQGPRIPDSEMSQLFQPFSRLENARTNGAPGTGLGLAICERLARLMGGDIGVHPARSREGEGFGNEFWLSIPLVEAIPAAADPLADAMPARRMRRVNVLLVEDIPANHLVTATMLRRLGHRVDIAETGADALHMIERHAYDLVFMDLLMPGMSGYEATRRIRGLPGSERGVPIVALTANTSMEDRARCIAAGMNDMLGKPIRPVEIAEVMASVLSHSRSDSLTDPSGSLSHRGVPMGDGAGGRRDGDAAGAAENSGASPLDMARMADLQRGLPEDMFASLVDECLSDIADRLPELAHAVGERDAVAIEETAHTLAGLSGTYGFSSMEGRMRKMMAAARRRDFITADLECAQIEAEIARAGEAIRVLFHDRAAA